MTLPKLIAVDLDGTFFDDHQQVNADKFTALLDRLDAAGGHFVAATGNSRDVVDHFLAPFVGRFDYVIQNGGQVVTKDNETLALHGLDQRQLELVKATVEADDLAPRHGNVYSTATDGYMMRADKGQGELYQNMVMEFPNLIFIDDLSEIPDPVIKIILNWPESEATPFMAKLNAELAGTAHHYGVAFADMMAFGDGANDIEMLQAVGQPFAMTNAAPALLEQFPQTVADNNHDGVLDTIAAF